MTKKHLIPLMIVFVAIILILLLYLHFQKNNDIPILNEYGIEFGMSPQNVEDRFGRAMTKNKDICDTNHVAYEHATEVLDQQATLTCYYADNKLVRVDIKWNTNSFDAAKALGQRAEERIVERYSSEKGYFYNSTNNENNCTISLGVDDGATGMLYSIIVDGHTVHASCVDNK